METIERNTYSTRQFLPAEVEIYKAIRLEALQKEPGMFGNSYAAESAFANEQCMARVSNPNSACFGLYCNSELIGLTGIVIPDAEKPNDAYMTQSYIRNSYRGIRLSRLLYDVRIEWAHKQGVTRLVIGCRASNIPSFAANQRYGFKPISRESRTWHDSTTEDMVYYELFLQKKSIKICFFSFVTYF